MQLTIMFHPLDVQMKIHQKALFVKSKDVFIGSSLDHKFQDAYGTTSLFEAVKQLAYLSLVQNMLLEEQPLK